MSNKLLVPGERAKQSEVHPVPMKFRIALLCALLSASVAPFPSFAVDRSQCLKEQQAVKRQDDATIRIPNYAEGQIETWFQMVNNSQSTAVLKDGINVEEQVRERQPSDAVNADLLICLDRKRLDELNGVGASSP